MTPAVVMGVLDRITDLQEASFLCHINPHRLQEIRSSRAMTDGEFLQLRLSLPSLTSRWPRPYSPESLVHVKQRR